MPALVNYSGDGDFYSSRFYSIGSHLDAYSPPCKRARIRASYVFEPLELEHNVLPSIEVLPDECLYEIFRRLHGDKERSSCACVSKHWLMLLSSIRQGEICESKSRIVDGDMTVPPCNDVEMFQCDGNREVESDGYLTRSLEGKKATDVRLAAIAVGTRGHGGLGKLSIRGSNSTRNVTDLGLRAIARGCPSLKSLSLWDVPLIGDEGLLEISKECKILEKLDLCNCPLISDKGLVAIAQNCPNLFSLNIECCSRITNKGLQAVGKLCSKLHTITLKDCPLVGDNGVLSLLSSTSSILSKVKFQGLSITDFSLAVIGNYGKSITNLVLGGLHHVSEKGFWVMGKARNLERLVSLTISSCRGITDVSLEAIANGCTNLKQMCLRKCCFVSDNGVVAFVKAARSFESLQLEECNKITQSGIVWVISNCGAKLKTLSLVKCMGIKDEVLEMPNTSPCSSLHSLSIKSCPGFGSAILATLGKMCPQLQHIDLVGLYRVTDSGLLPLIECCKAGLVKVNFSGCMNLTDKVITTLAMQHSGTLELLNLDGCRKITDASLAAVAKNCLFLSELDVSKCDVSDSGVAMLSSAEQLNLQVLSLSGCSGVSNKSLPCLKKLGRTLLGLNLQNCCSISSNMVQWLVESLWRCDILF